MFVSMLSVTLALVAHRLLRDYFKLTLFGHMKPQDVKYKRWRLSHQDGTLYLLVLALCWTLFFAIQGYFAFLSTKHNNNDDDDNSNGGIRMVTVKFTMTLCVLVKDWFMLVVVIDHMLQEVRQRYTVGFDAYVKSPAVEYVEGLEEWKKKERFYKFMGESSVSRQRGGENNSNSISNSATSSIMSGLSLGSGSVRVSVDSSVSDMGLDNLEGGDRELEPLSKKAKEKLIRRIINQSSLVVASKWWNIHRLWTTRVVLLTGWGLLAYALVSYFKYVLSVLDDSTSGTTHVGMKFYWSAEDVTERQRLGAACTSAMLNLVMLTQDWDMADWHNVDLRIVGCNIKDITLKLPAFIDEMLRHHRAHFIHWHRHDIIHNHHLFFHSRKRRPSQHKQEELSDTHVMQHVHHSYLYVSVKWLTLLPLFLFASFDWLHWWSILTYRPCDYLQLWDSTTGYLYSVSSDLPLVSTDSSISSYDTNSPFSNMSLSFIHIYRVM